MIPLPGGFQPRAAVAYSLVVALEVAAACGAGEGLRSEIDVAAHRTESLVEAWGPDSREDSLAKALARGLHGTVPLIAGAGLTAPIAYRWKTQLNENAKMPSFSNELPELDHNEIAGWDGAKGLGRFSAVFLDDSDLHPRIRQRIELTRGLIASRGIGHLPRREPRRDADRAARLARAARRPRVALPGGAARRRPDAVDALDKLKQALDRG